MTRTLLDLARDIGQRALAAAILFGLGHRREAALVARAVLEDAEQLVARCEAGEPGA